MKQALNDRLLPPLPARFPDQAMGQARVGGALHAFERELDADLAAGGQHVRVELRTARRTELARPIDLAFNAFAGHVRIELEGMPTEMNGRRQARLAHRRLQPALADIAPGADDVGVDGDGERWHGASHSLWPFLLALGRSMSKSKLAHLTAIGPPR